jgi:hypothetical protein
MGISEGNIVFECIDDLLYLRIVTFVPGIARIFVILRSLLWSWIRRSSLPSPLGAAKKLDTAGNDKNLAPRLSILLPPILAQFTFDTNLLTLR